MKKNEKKYTKTIGIIEGGGTGLEVANVFKKFVTDIYTIHKKGKVEFYSFLDRLGYRPHSFLELKNKFYNEEYASLKKIIKKEVNDLKKFYIECKKRTLGIFRTAINAETLYYLRRILVKLKVVPLMLKVKNNDWKVLFIRDQIQGYYSNEKMKCKGERLEVISSFSQKNFEVITKFAKEMITKFEIDKKNYDLIFIYKYHLFGLELHKMIIKALDKAKLNIPSNRLFILQPDSAMHKLLGEVFSNKLKDTVIIAGNEIGDVLLETLLHYYRIATKETFFTLNIALFHAIDHAWIQSGKPLEVLQTMHGSADDIAGKNLINPIATIRAAAYCLENWLKLNNIIEKTERAIKEAIKERYITKDMGGNKGTNEVVDWILAKIKSYN